MSGAITATTIGIVAGVGAAGAIGGAAISAHAAGKAADTQASAADRAAQLQYQASQDALAFQKQQWNTQQQNLAPWLSSGKDALTNLNYLLGIGAQPGAQPQTPALPSNGTPVSAGLGGAPASQAAGQQHMVNPQGTVGGYNPFPSNMQGSAYTGGNPAASGGPALGAGQSPAPAPTAPGAATGQSAVNTSLGAYGSLMQPYSQQFTAPTNLTEQNDPGYQARLALGTDAIQRSAAARGNVLTGGTAKALDQYAQDYASNEYGNVYNRAFNQYAQNYNQYEQQQANQYNRLASLAGVGQQTAQQLGLLGNQASQNVSSNLLGTAANMGQQYNNAAAANASGYVGAANAWSGALNNGASSLSNLLLLKQLGGGGGSGALTIGGNGSITNYGY